VVIAVAPLIHIEIPRQNKPVDELKASLQLQIDVIDENIAQIEECYDKGLLSGNEAYAELRNTLIPRKNEILASNKKLVKDKLNQNRKFGWKDWRAFANGWGMRLPYILFCLLITFLIKRINTQDQWLKSVFIIVQTIIWTQAIYQQVYSFWPGQDLPIKVYRPTILILAALSSLVIIMFVDWYKFKITRLEEIAKNLIGFSFIIESVKNYISPEKKNQYIKDRTLIIKKALEDE